MLSVAALVICLIKKFRFPKGKSIARINTSCFYAYILLNSEKDKMYLILLNLSCFAKVINHPGVFGSIQCSNSFFEQLLQRKKNDFAILIHVSFFSSFLFFLF